MAIVGVVAMVFVAIFVYRKKKSKKVVLQHTAFSNPVYEGKELQQTWHKIAIEFVCLFVCLLTMPRCYFFFFFFAIDKQASDALDSQLTAEGVCGVLTWVPSEYEEPVSSAPQYEMV